MQLRRMLSLFLLVTATATAQSEWPEWRGPTANGHSTATNLPLTWSETNNIAWKVPIHDVGHSTPVVQNGKIWTTAADKKGGMRSR